jgi:transcriptional regulator with PAS, ATPase and Fis domain
MQSASITTIEPPELAKAGVSPKKTARSSWVATRSDRKPRVWSSPDANQASSLPDRTVFRSVRTFGPLAAVSPAMQEVLDVLDRFARTNVTVTLLGETGTGKDVVAHALHEESPRANGPFVVFDCGAVAPNLAESELLGHERGAFTGAVSAYAGAFERANGGTLFLDEIGELPLDLQPRLLRVLESRRVRRVGGTKDRPLDVRIICATHRALRAGVAAGLFRQDLYFRLAAAVVAMPPLRERLEDLPLLARSLLDDQGYGNLKIGDATIKALRAHTWPGNVRELKNALACAAAFVDGSGVLDPRHLRLLSAEPGGEEHSGIDRLPLGGQTLERIERVAIQQTMARTEGNKVHAAQALGIAVSTLYEKLKKYGL